MSLSGGGGVDRLFYNRSRRHDGVQLIIRNDKLHRVPFGLYVYNIRKINPTEWLIFGTNGEWLSWFPWQLVPLGLPGAHCIRVLPAPDRSFRDLHPPRAVGGEEAENAGEYPLLDEPSPRRKRRGLPFPLRVLLRFIRWWHRMHDKQFADCFRGSEGQKGARKCQENSNGRLKAEDIS